MPYLRCPTCRLTVHLVADGPDAVQCPRCRAGFHTAPEARPAPSVDLVPVTGTNSTLDRQP
jgi:ribosomal protein L34E